MTRARIIVTCGKSDQRWGYENYVDAIEKSGAEAYLAPPGVNPADVFDFADGLIVSGGTDVSSEMYGVASHKMAYAPDLDRDATEARLLKSAWRREIPVLSVCRGFQMLNVIRGGKLQQHIHADNHRPGFNETHKYHEVFVTPHSLLAKLAQKTHFEVNSRHHQAVLPSFVGRGLIVSAMSPDGLVEAIEHPLHEFFLGVQWHPERPEMFENQRPIFDAFIAASSHNLARKTIIDTRPNPKPKDSPASESEVAAAG